MAGTMRVDARAAPRASQVSERGTISRAAFVGAAELPFVPGRVEVKQCSEKWESCKRKALPGIIFARIQSERQAPLAAQQTERAVVGCGRQQRLDESPKHVIRK